MLKGINKEVYRKVFKIGLPVSLENMIYSLVNFIDVFMVGKENVILGLGTTAVAGLGFASQLFMIFVVSLFGINSGGGILAAQYFGNKDYKNLKKCLGMTIMVGLVLSALFLFSALFFPANIINVFTKDSVVINLGARYLSLVVWTYPLVAISFAINIQLRAIGKTKYSFYSSILGLIINIIFNYTLIYGNLGFPAMGVKGAAIATIISRLLGTIYIIFIIYKEKLPIAGKFSELFELGMDFFIKAMKISLPVFIHEIIWVVGASIYVVIYGRIGTDSAASIQIVKSVSNLVFTLIFGLSSATSAIIGNEIGAGNEERAYRYSIQLLKISLFIGICIAIIVNIVSPLILRLMGVSSHIYPIARQVIFSEGILIIIKTVSLLLIVGILRAGGDTLWTMFVDIIPMWGFAIPLTYFTGLKIGLPIAVVYLFSASDELIKIFPCLKRLKSKKWINNLVKD